MSNQFLDMDNVIRVWLDAEDAFGIVEALNDTLGTIFYPIERNQSYFKNKYSIIDFHWCPNYQGARKYIKPYVTGRLSKRSINILES